MKVFCEIHQCEMLPVQDRAAYVCVGADHECSVHEIVKQARSMGELPRKDLVGAVSLVPSIAGSVDVATKLE